MHISFDILDKQQNKQNQFVLQSRALWNRMLVKEIANNPTVVIPTLQEVTLEQCKEYILQFHSTMWATFNVGDAKGLEKAANWLQTTINDVYTFVFRNEVGDNQSGRDAGIE